MVNKIETPSVLEKRQELKQCVIRYSSPDQALNVGIDLKYQGLVRAVYGYTLRQLNQELSGACKIGKRK